ncbi:RNA-binding domain-containing protein [Piedraia hortae CBS 480.64]|uniref:RNA-binding domain-containing protein n=1 Tax=Piedraia hortae CBS 480.64 TaxID=1314780 RepID=A0A6A7C419_9PEZI|nr:RNA-binding domain-containing protein [Piedraia hortae CBS 480.64]
MSAAVEAVTSQLSETTLNNPLPTAEGATIGSGGNAPINASQNEAVIASAAEGRRLYIGNLAYATSEGELKDFFNDYLVESTSIPLNPRTTRPVGYAFVDVATPAEAERAIQELNGKSILDRKVSVQLARKPDANTEGEAGEGKPARRQSARRGRNRGRGNRAQGGRRATNDEAEATGENAGGEATASNVPAHADALTQTTNEAVTAEAGAEGASTAKTKGKPNNTRPRKQRGPPEDGIPSKTKIMVANLPYELREEKLLEIFADYSPTSAKIALRPIPKYMVRKLQARNEPRKGRGFGFVTLASEELQKKCCDEMNGKEIDGREIAVKVAIDSPGKEDEDPNVPSKGKDEAAAQAEDKNEKSDAKKTDDESKDKSETKADEKAEKAEKTEKGDETTDGKQAETAKADAAT